MSASDPMGVQGERLMVEMASTVDGDGWWRPVGVPLGDRQLSLWAVCWLFGAKGCAWRAEKKAEEINSLS